MSGSLARRWLRVLRGDLLTVRADPLPASLWLRWLPHGVVCLTAFVIAIAALQQLLDWGLAALAYPIALAQGGAVVLALWRPVPAWWLSIAGTVAGAVALQDWMGVVEPGQPVSLWTTTGVTAHVLVLLLLALRVPTRVSAEVLVLTALVTYVLQRPLSVRDSGGTGTVTVLLSAVVVVLGMALRGRREARSELVRQSTLTAEERARRTLLEERSRIARELHDVVAHHMSVISIQAQVAPHLAENPSEELKENLGGIRQNALEALAELRRVLGVLRSEDPDDPYGLGVSGAGSSPNAPQPTLERLDALIDNTRAAGLVVTADIEGEAPVYAPGLELSAYRIVQESLSNALRHAPGSAVRVEIHHLRQGLHLGIVNSRPRQPTPPSSGTGHGLLGMRERAAMLGGHVTATRTPDGGFAVTAFLPRDAHTGGIAGSAAPVDPSGPYASDGHHQLHGPASPPPVPAPAPGDDTP
ncbi:sensor histidine kinase [Streptomyces sp. NPDC086783]|uniref:sensor histidine kinase n=1 Tax=Streptomyces sp. NPDC086783 TaxID=3365758 RepID=UPI0037F42864